MTEEELKKQKQKDDSPFIEVCYNFDEKSNSTLKNSNATDGK